MKQFASHLLLALVFVTLPAGLLAQESPLADTNLSGLSLRGIGPAMNSGRIADIDIHPDDESIWYVAVGSGGVWKTTNNGTTFEPIFDNESSYSIGDVTIDPSEPSTVWVGTGENHGGRHLGFGDGIYKSTDGGRSWTNMGLEETEHLSTIIVHPENSDVVWVAAQGPLWSSGGQRGLYKTTDGGETWRKVLGEGEWTGVTDIVIDPRNPDRLIAATWDRHRTVAAYLGGGPGTGLHKSDDGGETWRALSTGLPGGPLGKIGLAISPQNPDRVYAAIETTHTDGGLWMSENRGESWRKMSDAVAGGTGPHYYQELYASPHQEGRLYLVSNVTQISDNHGADFSFMNVNDKHVDDHAIAFKKSDPDYVLIGSDGGLYETFDLTESWRYVRNLPLTQYYKISVDDSEPFYNIYGGLQDNGSTGGPSRTTYDHGIRNADWYATLGADGHDSATEPGNPNIFYAETQQGGLHRIDRTTRDQVFIQPQAREDEPFERFNWDAPIEVSPHSPTRIYFASYRVWRTDDRGDSWTPISGDLTRNEERITLDHMGRQQGWDNAWDVGAMSNYNTITSLGESPVEEGVIYAGTDDGLLWVTEDIGANWRRIEVGDLPGVPATAFVNDIKGDMFDANTVYVALDNHKYGDFAPYLVKSTDRGQTWTSITGDLPARHLVWRLVQDHVEPNLMFAATEFGIFATVDGGQQWVKVPGSPTISFRDVDIQRDHGDVVGASFGRGIFVLDDYTPLREMTPERLAGEGALFGSRPTFWFTEDNVSYDQGDGDYRAPNPPYGAVFTYYLRDGYRSMEEEREASEEDVPEGQDIPFPGYDAIEDEMREQGPSVEVVVRGMDGNVINRVSASTSAGVHRVNWELDYSSSALIGLEGGDGSGGGFLALPGRYTAELVKIDQGAVTTLDGPMEFEVVELEGALPRVSDTVIEGFRAEVEAFQLDLAGAQNSLSEQVDWIEALQTALSRADTPDAALSQRLYDTRLQLLDLREQMQGSEARREVGERSPPTPGSRLFTGFRGLNSTYGPTELHRQTVAAGRAELVPIAAEIERMEGVVDGLHDEVMATGAPPVERGGG